jgi:multidrug efflux system outer membrane protein
VKQETSDGLCLKRLHCSLQRKNMNRLMLLGSTLATASILSGCMVGPHYQRPAVTAPPIYRDAAPATATPTIVPDNASPSLGDLQWSEVFKDEELKTLVAEAIRNNYDLRIAAQRVLEQQARVGIARSQSLPSVSGGAAYSAIGIPANALGAGSASTFHGGGLTAAAAWNLDFWGLYRRQTEAMRAELLATEWGHRATLSTVVIEVTTSYIQLRSLDAELEIARKTIDARRDTLRLITLRESVGSATMTDVHQSQQLLHGTEAVLPGLELQMRQEENNLSLLLGRDPGPISRGTAALLLADPLEIPPGIPSQLLERRPDIQQAEAKLIAANARIGVARAQFFPQVSITGMGGTATSQFDKLFNTDSRFWFGAISITQPLFTGGKLRNNLHLTEETEKEAAIAYRQSIASAFRDVSNALIGCRKSRENRIALEAEIAEAREVRNLALTRYNNGRTGNLEVLASDTALLSEEMSLANSRQQEALSLVQLYSALGGGWK